MLLLAEWIDNVGARLTPTEEKNQPIVPRRYGRMNTSVKTGFNIGVKTRKHEETIELKAVLWQVIILNEVWKRAKSD